MVNNRPCKKLAYKFYGPFEILEKIGNAAYKLELPDTALIHPVFHVSQLKEHVPDHSPVFSSLPTTLDLSSSEAVPECILDRKMVKKGKTYHVQVLIKWTSHLVEEATWEDYDNIKARFPDARAWGQAGTQGGATVSVQSTLTPASVMASME